jgi:hypothetical protein
MAEQRVLLSTIDDEVAIEKGRLLAAQNLARDPDARKRCEEKFGLEFCKRQWPEVYSPSPFFKRLIDKLNFRGD